MWNNEIVLGDCYKLIKDIPDKSIDLIITDPPYQIQGLHQGTGIFKDRLNKYQGTGILQADGHKGLYIAELMYNNLGNGIDISILDEYMRVMKKPNIYLWCNKEQIYLYMTYFVKERDCRFEIFVWAKDNPPPIDKRTLFKGQRVLFIFLER